MKIKEALDIFNLPIFTKEYILMKILNKNRVFLHLNPDYEFDETQFLEIIKKIENGYPIEYIFQEVEFWGEKFFIKEGVLIPRDDTESLIEESLKELKNINFETIAEIGIGSGVISIILSNYFPNKNFIGTDINPLAIEVTNENIKNHKIKNIEIYQTSLLNNIDKKIDIIISNPPYVETTHEKPNQFEPDTAFFADEEGTFLLKEIVKEGIKREVKMVICEMGYNQKELMKKFFEEMKINKYHFYKDLTGNYRGFVLKLF